MRKEDAKPGRKVRICVTPWYQVGTERRLRTNLQPGTVAYISEVDRDHVLLCKGNPRHSSYGRVNIACLELVEEQQTAARLYYPDGQAVHVGDLISLPGPFGPEHRRVERIDGLLVHFTGGVAARATPGKGLPRSLCLLQRAAPAPATCIAQPLTDLGDNWFRDVEGRFWRPDAAGNLVEHYAAAVNTPPLEVEQGQRAAPDGRRGGRADPALVARARRALEAVQLPARPDPEVSAHKLLRQGDLQRLAPPAKPVLTGTYRGPISDGAGAARLGDDWPGSLAVQDEFEAGPRSWTINKTLREQRDAARWRCDDYDLQREAPRGPCKRCGSTTGCMHPRPRTSWGAR